jgi:hypothetical protein
LALRSSGRRHFRHLLDAIGELRVVGDRLAIGRHGHVPVEAEDAAEQLGAEPVHHRHDDDQGRHTEGDAQQREPGDDGDESLLPARAQIAHRHHPLERVEGHYFAANRRLSSPGLTRRSRIWMPGSSPGMTM